jgi:hypothetical protein
MINMDTSYLPWLISFVVLGVTAGLAGLAALADAVLRSRDDRLAAGHSVREHYRGTLVSH